MGLGQHAGSWDTEDIAKSLEYITELVGGDHVNPAVHKFWRCAYARLAGSSTFHDGNISTIWSSG